MIICGCALQETIPQSHIASFEVKQEIKPRIPIKKACWFELENTFYLWQQDSSLIHIYHNGKHLNTIGGSGSDKLNIQKVSDICLAPDGRLCILDSFEKRVIKINRKGSWVTDIALPKNIDPRLLAISIDERFFIYDENTGEIVVLKVSGEEDYRFGKMMFTEPQKLSFNGNTITVYDKDGNTYFFTRWGQFMENVSGNCYLENNRIFRLDKFYISALESEDKYAVSIDPWQEVYYETPNFLLTGKDKILAGRFIYEEIRN